MVTMIPIVVRALGTVPKILEEIPEGLEIRGRIKTIKNIVESPKDQRRFVITQSPLKVYQRRCEKLARNHYNNRDLIVTQTPVKGDRLTLL